MAKEIDKEIVVPRLEPTRSRLNLAKVNATITKRFETFL
jgi:hypothetical protein